MPAPQVPNTPAWLAQVQRINAPDVAEAIAALEAAEGPQEVIRDPSVVGAALRAIADAADRADA